MNQPLGCMGTMFKLLGVLSIIVSVGSSLLLILLPSVMFDLFSFLRVPLWVVNMVNAVSLVSVCGLALVGIIPGIMSYLLGAFLQGAARQVRFLEDMSTEVQARYFSQSDPFNDDDLPKSQPWAGFPPSSNHYLRLPSPRPSRDGEDRPRPRGKWDVGR